MIALWGCYVLAATTALLVGGVAIEYLVRACGGPTRIVWVAAIGAALTLSVVALARGNHESPPQDRALRLETTETLSALRPGSRPSIAGPQSSMATTDPGRTASTGAFLRQATTRLSTWDKPLLAIWAGSATLALLYQLVTFLRLTWATRRWTPRMIDGVSVLVSDMTGPAAFGALSMRIVIPNWVLALSNNERRTIIAHECEHVRAADPLVLVAASLATACLPWNAPLWRMRARLRFATETDCDARVLRRLPHEPASYSRLLVSAYERSTTSSAPLVALFESPSHLERRVRRMLEAKPPVRSRRSGVAALFGACGLVMAFVMPRPTRPGNAPHAFEGTVTYRYTGAPMDRTAAGADPTSHPPTTFVVSLKEPKARMDLLDGAEGEGGVSSVIYDGAMHTMTMITRARKFVGVTPYYQEPATVYLDSVMRRAVKSGQERIAGVPCDDYRGIDTDRPQLFVCVAQDRGSFFDFDMVPRTRGWFASVGPFAGFDDGYLPLEVGTIDSGRTTVDWVATAVTPQSLPDSLFTITATDYDRVADYRGHVVVRVADARRVIIATVTDAARTNGDSSADPIFLLTLVRPLTDTQRAPLDIPSGDVRVFGNGSELAVTDEAHPGHAIITTVENGENQHVLASSYPTALRVDTLVGLETIRGLGLTTAALTHMRPAPTTAAACKGLPRESCYEAGGHTLVFPR